MRGAPLGPGVELATPVNSPPALAEARLNSSSTFRTFSATRCAAAAALSRNSSTRPMPAVHAPVHFTPPAKLPRRASGSICCETVALHMARISATGFRRWGAPSRHGTLTVAKRPSREGHLRRIPRLTKTPADRNDVAHLDTNRFARTVVSGPESPKVWYPLRSRSSRMTALIEGLLRLA